MSEDEPPARFHDWCAARHRKVETRWLWRFRCVMHAQRSPLTNVLIRSGSCAEANLYFGIGRYYCFVGEI